MTAIADRHADRFPPPRAAIGGEAPDPGLDRCLRRAVLVGLALVVMIPAARGHHAWLGWAPLWLLGMPLAAWWALHRFRLPRVAPRRTAPDAGAYRRRRRQPQARRRGTPLPGLRAPRAA